MLLYFVDLVTWLKQKLFKTGKFRYGECENLMCVDYINRC